MAEVKDSSILIQDVETKNIMTKSILLIGLGRFGRHIATTLNELGHEVMAIDHNEERINDILPYVTSAQIGDSTNEEFLESLGISNYDVCIVAIANEKGSLDHFRFPVAQKGASRFCDINKVIDASDTNITKLKPETRLQLEVWQEFIDQTIAHGDTIPSFPIWAMEFGATYDFKNKAPVFQSLENLQGKLGKLGQPINGLTKEACIAQLPNYAQTTTSLIFPNWKIRYIEQNRKFYERNKTEFFSMKRGMAVGIGPTFGLTNEACLKMSETTGIPTNGYELEEYLHGPIYEVKKDTAVFLLDGDPLVHDRTIAIYNASHEVTDRVYLFTYSSEIKGRQVLNLSLTIDPLFRPLLYVLPFQYIPGKMCEDLGIRAITIYNYRASCIAETKTDH